MPPLPAMPEPVPFDEIAEAARSVPGGPPAFIVATGRHLAAALDAAGFLIVRGRPPGAQLTH